MRMAGETMKLRLGFMIAIIVMLLAACGGNGIKDPLNYEIEDFTFTNQEGEELGLKDLEGKVWVADFIYTYCATECPPMTFNMSKLQKLVKEEGIENVEFVSFSIDPEVDSPEVLKEYGGKFDLNFDSFHFLTGYDQPFIESFALDNFKALVKKPENQDQVIHQVYFYLVDQNGTIMKYYNGFEDVPFADIISDIKALQ